MIRKRLPAVIVFLLFLGAWEFGVRVFNVQQFILPPPSAIVSSITDNGESLREGLWRLIYEAVGGLALGITLALVGSLLAVRWQVARRALLPFAIGLNAVPMIIFAPIMNNWFGSISPLSNMMIVVTLVYYPVLINLVRGLTQVEQGALDLMLSYGARPLDIFWKLRVPNALPYFINGLKLSATLSVIGVVVAGYFGGPRNAIGVWILSEAAVFRFPSAWGGVLIACAVGITLYVLVLILERVLIPWHTSLQND